MMTEQRMNESKRSWMLAWRRQADSSVKDTTWKVSCGALVLYTLLAVVVLSPLAHPELPDTPGSDLANHLSGIIEARNALKEGQFPIRIAPNQVGGERYPIFQFYGNFPYTVGGMAFWILRANPYVIWKWVVGFFLVLGGFFTYRSALLLWRQALPAVATGAVFLTAPYMLTDIHGRFAYPEFVSFNLLPVVFFYLWRCFQSPGVGAVLAAGISWCFLAGSHNVTYLFASFYFAIFLLLHFSWRREYGLGLLRVGLGYGLGLALAAWYIAPQLALLHEIGIKRYADNAGFSAWLTPLGVLLAPTVVPPVHLPTIYIYSPMQFGLQIGWPLLAGVALSLYYLRETPGGPQAEGRVTRRLLALFALSLVMVWTPVNFWGLLPRLFQYAQFTYRLLMFVALWGALLAGFALTRVFRQGMRMEHLLLCVLLLGLFTSPYLAPHKSGCKTSVEQEIAHPEMGRGGASVAYRINPDALVRTTFPCADINWAHCDYGLADPAGHVLFPCFGELPAPQPDDVLHLEGVVPAEYRTPVNFAVHVNDKPLGVTSLPPGPFRLDFPIEGAFDEPWVRITLNTDRCLDPETRAIVPPVKKGICLVLHTLKWEKRSPSNKPLVLSGAQVRASCPETQPKTYYFHLANAGLVQLPVLFYPHMQRVRVDGKDVPYGNLGRNVAMALPAGGHAVTVRFIGLRWANWVSVAGWMVILATFFSLGIRWLRLRKPSRRRTSPLQVRSFSTRSAQPGIVHQSVEDSLL
jgi:hypothetical protein